MTTWSQIARCLVLAAGVVLASADAHAEPLDKKAASALRLQASQMDKLIAELEKYADRPRLFTERVKLDYDRKVQKVADKLATLPQDHPDVKAELAHLQRVRAALAVRAGELAAAQGAIADELATITALVTAPGFAADLASAQRIAEVFQSGRPFKADVYWVERPASNDENKRDLALAQAATSSLATYDALRTKYKLVIETRRKVDGHAMEIMAMAAALGRSTDDRDEYVAALAAFRTNVPTQIAADAKQVSDGIAAAVAARTYHLLSGDTGDIVETANRMQNQAAVWAAVAPAGTDTAKVTAQAAATQAQLDQALTKVATEIIAANRAPAEAYAGPDRAKLEAFVRAQWNTMYAKEAIAAVRFEEAAFTRDTGMDWDQSNQRWVKFDHSRIALRVIAAGKDGEVILWPAAIYRRHLAGDRLDFYVDHLGTPPPQRRMLKKNL